ncbi:MAG TPA: M50 family metallopeptidase [Dehalococcoidia bacterium]|nr:M50 family metallopeptidase [Dehalococcoidia bacterium]
MDILTHYILPFVGILLGIVVIHEAGHYITAKLFGVKVLEAGIGLPPRIWGFRWRETDYTINAMPIGAFVRLLGEEDPTDPRSLAAQAKWKRTIIIGAGAFMNLVLAIALFAAGLMIPHTVSAGGAQIASVAPGSPAEQAGLKPGDQIYKVDGRVAQNTSDASYLIHLHQGSTINFTVLRKNPATGALEQFATSAYARWDPPSYADECGVKHSQGPTGITIGAVNTLPVETTAAERATMKAQAESDFAAYRKSIAASAPAWCYAGTSFGFTSLTPAQCAGQLDAQAQADARALKDKLFPTLSNPCVVWTAPRASEAVTKSTWEPPQTAIPHGLRMSFESLILARNQIWSLVRGFGSAPVTGPVGIAQATGEVVHQAGWLSLLTLAGSISMSLAMLNILPLPMVDGGRLVFILIEFLRRGKRVAPEREALVHLAGFAAMIMLAAVVTYFDVARIIHGGSLLR